MRRPAVALVLLAALAAAPAARAGGVQVTSAVSPHPTRFGDVIHATIVVRGDARANVQPGFAPFAVLRSSSSSTGDGGVTVTTFRFDLQCLEAICAPGPGARTVRLSPSRVRVGSSLVQVTVPAVRVVPRTTAAQVGRPARALLHPTAVPPPTYRADPGTVRAVLSAVALALVLVAALLLAPLARLRRMHPAAAGPDALARALAFVRAARTRPPADRRRALSLLARTLRDRDDPADAGAAGALAWSEPEPDPATMTGLADRVEERA